MFNFIPIILIASVMSVYLLLIFTTTLISIPLVNEISNGRIQIIEYVERGYLKPYGIIICQTFNGTVIEIKDEGLKFQPIIVNNKNQCAWIKFKISPSIGFFLGITLKLIDIDFTD